MFFVNWFTWVCPFWWNAIVNTDSSIAVVCLHMSPFQLIDDKAYEGFQEAVQMILLLFDDDHRVTIDICVSIDLSLLFQHWICTFFLPRLSTTNNKRASATIVMQLTLNDDNLEFVPLYPQPVSLQHLTRRMCTLLLFVASRPFLQRKHFPTKTVVTKVVKVNCYWFHSYDSVIMSVKASWKVIVTSMWALMWLTLHLGCNDFRYH